MGLIIKALYKSCLLQAETESGDSPRKNPHSWDDTVANLLSPFEEIEE